MPLNIPLIKKIIEEINKNPLLYNQENFVELIDINTGLSMRDAENVYSEKIEDIAESLIAGKLSPTKAAKLLLEVEPEKTVCKSACCIAGTAAKILVGNKNLIPNNGHDSEVKFCGRVQSLEQFVQDKLGVSQDAKAILFTATPGHHWPNPYCVDWENANEEYDKSKQSFNQLFKLRKKQVKITTALLTDLIKKGEYFLFGG